MKSGIKRRKDGGWEGREVCVEECVCVGGSVGVGVGCCLARRRYTASDRGRECLDMRALVDVRTPSSLAF